MTHSPNLLEKAFDHLSSFPYLNLRKVLKRMWIFSTILFGFSLLLEGIEVFKGNEGLSPEWIKNLVLWTGINPVFAYVLYLWKKRSNEKISTD